MVLFCLAICFPASAQTPSDIRITVHGKDRPLVQILDEIGRQSDCSFIIRDNDVETGTRLSIDAENESLGNVLTSSLRHPKRRSGQRAV